MSTQHSKMGLLLLKLISRLYLLISFPFAILVGGLVKIILIILGKDRKDTINRLAYAYGSSVAMVSYIVCFPVLLVLTVLKNILKTHE